MPVHIRRTRPEDAATLTAIAFAAKQHWGYPEKWIEGWRDLLTIKPDFIASQETYAANVDGRDVGFYALEHKDGALDLSHLWVLPEAMSQGIGRSLFNHAVERAATLGFKELKIESDPNAEEFYRHMGARRVGSRIVEMDCESREVPLLVYSIHGSP